MLCAASAIVANTQQGPICYLSIGLNLTGSPRTCLLGQRPDPCSSPTVPLTFAQETDGMNTCIPFALAHFQGTLSHQPPASVPSCSNRLSGPPTAVECTMPALSWENAGFLSPACQGGRQCRTQASGVGVGQQQGGPCREQQAPWTEFSCPTC